MQLTPFAILAATFLVTCSTCHANGGFFTKLGRNLGYGISDGYHAQRDCLVGAQPWADGSPVMHPPMMYQPMMHPSAGHPPIVHQPAMHQPAMHQPPMNQRLMQTASSQPPMMNPPLGRPPMRQPMMVPPAHAAPPQPPFQQASHPAAYPVTQATRPWSPPNGPGYVHPMANPAAQSDPRAVVFW